MALSCRPDTFTMLIHEGDTMNTITADEATYTYETRHHYVTQAMYAMQMLIDNIVRSIDFEVVNAKHLCIEAMNIEGSIKHLAGLIDKHDAEVRQALAGDLTGIAGGAK